MELWHATRVPDLPDVKAISCPACESSIWIPWHAVMGPDGDAHRYGRCASCGLVALLTQADAGSPQWYDDAYFRGGGAQGGYHDYERDAADHLRNARDRLDRVSRLVARPGFLIDVGCASGFFLDAARDAGWRVAGVEVSRWAADRARDRGHRVVHTIDELDGGEPVADAICFFQVLEHLERPRAALEASARLLRPGGIVICETWDAASRVARLSGRHWQQLSPPRVLWALTPGSGRALVLASGLEPVSWRRSTKVVSLGLVTGQLLGRWWRDPASHPGLSRLADAAAAVSVRYRGDDLVTFAARRSAPSPA